MTTRPEFSYIGRCPICGAYCEVVVDDPTDAKFTANTVAKMIKSGLTVTRVDTAFVRANFSGCTCNSKVEKQLKLFD